MKIIWNKTHQTKLRECRSIRSGASVLPYCAPLVCISVVIELLPVWRHNKPKTKNQNHLFVYYSNFCVCVHIQSCVFSSSSIWVHIHRHFHMCCLCYVLHYVHVFFVCFLLCAKLNRHLCYGVYWFNHTPTHILIL